MADGVVFDDEDVCNGTDEALRLGTDEVDNKFVTFEGAVVNVDCKLVMTVDVLVCFVGDVFNFDVEGVVDFPGSFADDDGVLAAVDTLVIFVDDDAGDVLFNDTLLVCVDAGDGDVFFNNTLVVCVVADPGDVLFNEILVVCVDTGAGDVLFNDPSVV